MSLSRRDDINEYFLVVSIRNGLCWVTIDLEISRDEKIIFDKNAISFSWSYFNEKFTEWYDLINIEVSAVIVFQN